MGRSGKGSTTVGWPGWFPRVVTETDTGHEGPERPRGPTGGPLAATDGERRVGRALPRHGHALPTEPDADQSHQRNSPRRPPPAHAPPAAVARPPRRAEGIKHARGARTQHGPRNGPNSSSETQRKGCPRRSPEAVLAYACCAGLAPTKSRVAGPAPFYVIPPKHGGRAVPRPPGPLVFSGSLWPSGAPVRHRTMKSERVTFVS